MPPKFVKWTLVHQPRAPMRWICKQSGEITDTEETVLQVPDAHGLFHISFRRIWNDSSALMLYCATFLNNDRQRDLLSHLQAMMATGQFQEDVPFVMGKRQFTGRLVKDVGDPGMKFTYSGQTIKASGWHGLEALRDHVSAVLGVRFNYAHIVAYNFTERQRAKKSSLLLGWHKDDESEHSDGAPIAALSLGAEATFAMKRDQKTSADETFYLDVPLASGSLFVMGGNMQKQNGWQHAVRRIPGAGQRVSITFRVHKN